jgi:hypothetical protein
MTGLEQEVADRYHEYHNAFVQAGKTRDVTLLRPYSHVPQMAVAGGRVIVSETEEKSDARWSRILGNLPADYDNSVAHSVDVTMFSKNSALVTVDVSRFRKDGTEYERFCGSYIMVRADAGWQISTWLVHDSMEALRTRRF